MLCTVSVKDAVELGDIVCIGGLAATEKSPLGAGLIVTATFISLVRPPPIALRVIVEVPVCVALLVTSVKVELVVPFAGGVADAGFQAVP